MDSILKNRYDAYRAKGAFPPEARELEKEGLRPFDNLLQLNEWREKVGSLKVVDRDHGYELRGKIDDVLVESDGRLVPADYKSSGNAPSFDKQRYYRDQLAAYGFMFRFHGHKTADRAYLLHYYPVDKTRPDIAVEFTGHVDRVDIGSIDIEAQLEEIVIFLNDPYPGHNSNCQKCAYYVGRSNIVEGFEIYE